MGIDSHDHIQYTWVEVISKLARVSARCSRTWVASPSRNLAKNSTLTAEKVVEVQSMVMTGFARCAPLGEDGDSEFGDLVRTLRPSCRGRRVLHPSAGTAPPRPEHAV